MTKLFARLDRIFRGPRGWLAGVAWAIALLILPALFATVEPAHAQMGGIQVLPTRIVFEGRKRAAQVTVINNGKAAVTYRISFKNMRMKEDGSYEDVKEARPDEWFADKYIRYSPRQVVLQPGTSQTVRLLLRKKSKMPPGEYRSHMLFRALPPKDAGKSIETEDRGKSDIRVRLIPIFGVTIPVILRHGDLSASVKIDHLKIIPSKSPEGSPRLSIRFNREGRRSIYGDVIVTFTPDKGGAPLEVARANGVSVFTPNKTRTFKMKLRPPEGVELRRGRLHVVYKENQKDGDRIMAEKELQVP